MYLISSIRVIFGDVEVIKMCEVACWTQHIYHI